MKFTPVLPPTPKPTSVTIEIPREEVDSVIESLKNCDQTMRDGRHGSLPWTLERFRDGLALALTGKENTK